MAINLPEAEPSRTIYRCTSEEGALQVGNKTMLLRSTRIGEGPPQRAHEQDMAH